MLWLVGYGACPIRFVVGSSCCSIQVGFCLRLDFRVSSASSFKSVLFTRLMINCFTSVRALDCRDLHLWRIVRQFSLVFVVILPRLIHFTNLSIYTMFAAVFIIWSQSCRFWFAAGMACLYIFQISSCFRICVHSHSSEHWRRIYLLAFFSWSDLF